MNLFYDILWVGSGKKVRIQICRTGYRYSGTVPSFLVPDLLIYWIICSNLLNSLSFTGSVSNKK